MKIVIIPGVGFHEHKENHLYFKDQISSKIPNCEIEIFYWQHNLSIPPIPNPYKTVRKWVCEIILDFQHVIKYAQQTEVPSADYYIGHSAGSILALVQENPSCVTFGSPAVLVDIIRDKDENEISISSVIGQKKSILNIVNKYDQLAYNIPFDNVENYVYAGPWWNFNAYNPYVAHYDYWRNPEIIKKIVNSLISIDQS
ncbi:MAG: hypothetical protein WC119_01095 [Synergistaceae bacterium]